MLVDSKSFKFLLFAGILHLALLGQREISAHITVESDSLAKSEILPGGEILVTDPLHEDPDAGLFEIAKRIIKVSLVYNRQEHTDVDGRLWSYEVDYVLEFVDSGFPNESGTLKIGTNSVIYEAVRIHNIDHGKVRLIIDDANPNNPREIGPSSVPQDIHLELSIETERYRFLSPSDKPIISFDFSTDAVRWTSVAGAEEYDLEWIFVDARSTLQYDSYFESDETDLSELFDLIDPVRITTSKNHYVIDKAYPLGLLFFRARAVGRFIRDVEGDHSHVKNGAWSTAFMHIEIDEEGNVEGVLEPLKNWQYVASYSEGGKHKNVLTYYDGSLRNRQTLTNLSTDTLTIVAETKYDYEGRGVLSILPVPKFGTALDYVPKFNRNSSGNAYSKLDFDRGVVSRLDSTSGASKYYSSNNDFTGTHRDYIPNAYGYPFSQVEYTRDNTGRVRRSSGVGEKFMFGSDRETKYFYGNANDTELSRLFGTNVGKASHYKKSLVRDANGQISVSYLDQEGRVIATALAGESPENLVALPENSPDSITVSLNGNNEIDLNDNVSQSVTTILNVIPGTKYEFFYELNGGINKVKFDNIEPPDSICATCVYDLEIWITEPDSYFVKIPDVSTGSNVDVHKRTIGSPSFDSADTASTKIEFSVEFENIGEYTVTKKLTLNSGAIDTLIEVLKENPAFPNLDTLKAEYESKVDTTLCDVITCRFYSSTSTTTSIPEPEIDVPEVVVDVTISIEGDTLPSGDLTINIDEGGITPYTPTELERPRQTTECDHYIFDVIREVKESECLALRGLLLHDVSPGGYLFEDDSWMLDNWKEVNYRDRNGNSLDPQPYTELEGLGLDDNEALSQFRDIWQSQWAQDLVIRHPERCHADICSENIESEIYDAKMAGIPSWEDAYSLGYLNPLNMTPTPQGPPYRVISDAPIDPYFVSGGLGEDFKDEMEEKLTDFKTITIPIAHPTDPTSEERTLSLWEFAEQRILYPMATTDSQIDTLKWYLFRGLYLGLKKEIHIQVLAERGCEFSNNENAQVIKPSNPITAGDDPDAAAEQACELICPDLCDFNVDYWMQVLEDQCSFESIAWLVRDELASYCQDRCEANCYSSLDEPIPNALQLLKLGLPAIAGYPHLLAVYYYLEGVGCDLTAIPDSVVTIEAPPDSLTQIDWEAVRDTCIVRLYREADFFAEQDFNEEADRFTTEFLKAHQNKCFEAPFTESFGYTYKAREYHYTLYYYDQAGNLVQTVPPEGVDNLSEEKIESEEQPQHRLITRYKYNSLDQVIWQSTPDGGETEFWYNDVGQLRFSQNSQQVTEGNYAYTKYDQQGRILEVGVVGGINRTTIENSDNINNTDFPDHNSASHTLTEITTTIYDTTAYQRSGSFLQENLRGSVSATKVEPVEGDTVSATYYGYDPHGNVKCLLRYINGLAEKRIDYEYDLVSGNVNAAYYQKDQVDQFIHRYEYDADNRLLSMQTSTDGVIWDEDAYYFYYNHGSPARLELGEDKVQGIDYVYTLQGWLKGVNSNTIKANRDPGKDGEESTTNLKKYFARDAFGFTLRYYDGDYAPIGGPTTIANHFEAQIGGSIFGQAAPELFNGNISSMVTAISEFMPNENSAPQGTAYEYDQLNRLIRMKAFQNLDVNNNSWHASAVNGSDNLDYLTEISYDANGNILTLMRNGKHSSGTTLRSPLAMDSLTYHYARDTNDNLINNRLLYIADSVSASNYPNVLDEHAHDIDNQSPFNYSYDEIGNLIRDNYEGITEIEWTAYRKVKSLTKEASHGPDLEFLYDAAGNRIAKIMKPHGHNQDQWVYTYYVRDASDNVMATYRRVFVQSPTNTGIFVDSIAVKDFILYGNERLGLKVANVPVLTIQFESSGFDSNGIFSISSMDSPKRYGDPESKLYQRIKGTKQYELTNHLGNVLETFSDKKIGVGVTDSNGTASSYRVQVQSATDYYPFGYPMPDRRRSSLTYSYGFNGMEKDDEIKGPGNSIAAEQRLYDPRSARWISFDPVIKPEESPFVGFSNNPIYNIDPTGADKIFYNQNFPRRKRAKIVLVQKPKNLSYWGGGAQEVIIEESPVWDPVEYRRENAPGDDEYFYEHESGTVQYNGKKYIPVWSPSSIRGHDLHVTGPEAGTGTNNILVSNFEDKMKEYLEGLGVHSWTYEKLKYESDSGDLDVAYTGFLHELAVEAGSNEESLRSNSLFLFGGKYGNANEAGNYTIGYAAGLSENRTFSLAVPYGAHYYRWEKEAKLDEANEQRVLKLGIAHGKKAGRARRLDELGEKLRTTFQRRE